MAEQQFFVFRNDAVSGPLTLGQLRGKLQAQELAYTDYIWEDELGAWQMMAIYFSSEFPAPKEPPTGHIAKAQESKQALREYSAESFAENIGISNESIWFLFRDNSKFGPYRYLELVRLLQTSACARDDFVWKPGFEDWQRLSQCADFEESVLKKLAHLKNFGVDKVFIQRRFPRVPYKGEVILHDERRVIFGAVKSLSEGGAFVEVQKLNYAKGDRIKIHFTPGAVAVPFNCIAEITQVVKGKSCGYNVKFIYLEEEDRKRIAQYAESVASRSAG